MTTQEASSIDWDEVKNLIRMKARNFHYKTGFDVQDAEAACWYAVARACEHYRPEMGSFGAYCNIAMERYMWADSRKIGSCVSVPRDELELHATNAELKEIRNMADTNNNADIRETEDWLIVEKLLNELPERQKQVITDIYLNGETHTTTGNSLGIHRNTVVKLLKLAIPTLRSRFDAVKKEEHI